MNLKHCDPSSVIKWQRTISGSHWRQFATIVPGLALGSVVQGLVAQPVAAECPTSINNERHHAVAWLDKPDEEIIAATVDMNIARPYLNPCTSPRVVDQQRWSSNVMWIVSEDRSETIEIGWRRVCTPYGPESRFFFACCNGTVTDSDYWRHPETEEIVEAVSGATYTFTIAFLEDEGDKGIWLGEVNGPGLPNGRLTGEIDLTNVAGDFPGGPSLEVGGENMYKSNDMGVTYFTAPRYLFASDSGVTPRLMIGDPDVEMHPGGWAPTERYQIFDDGEAYSIFTDIHVGPTPTPVAITDHCGVGW